MRDRMNMGLPRVVVALLLTWLTGAGLAGAAEVIGPPVPSLYQDAYIKASNPDGGDNFGRTVAYAEGLLVVGTPNERSADATDPDDNSVGGAGAAYVYSRTASGWQFETYLKAPSPRAGDGFGAAVATDGNILVVGAPRAGDDLAGRAYVFRDFGGGWLTEAVLEPTDGDPVDQFGTAVAVSGAIVAVGAPRDDGSGDLSVDAGAVYLFLPTQWDEAFGFRASSTQAGDQFGASLGVSGELLVVGAPRVDGSAANSGAAYLFHTGKGDVSLLATLQASNPDPGDQFGKVVAVSATTVVVGTDQEASGAVGVDGDASDNSARQAGAAYVFDLVAGSWQQVAYLKPSQVFQFEHFATSVAVSGDEVVVGASGEDGSATGVDGQQNVFGSESGAAYIFRRDSWNSWYQAHYLKAWKPGSATNSARRWPSPATPSPLAPSVKTAAPA